MTHEATAEGGGIEKHWLFPLLLGKELCFLFIFIYLFKYVFYYYYYSLILKKNCNQSIEP